MKRLTLLLIALAAGVIVAQDAARKGTVSADKLTIRAKPGTHFEKIGSFGKGETIEVIAEKDDWLEVRLPDKTSAWVPVDSISENGTVLEGGCQLYSGPAVVFTAFSKLPPGTRLELTGKASGNWRQVYAPSTSSGWVSKAFVAVEEAVAEVVSAAGHAVVETVKNDDDEAARKRLEEEKARQEAEIKRLEAEKAAQEAEAKRLEEEKAAQEAEAKRLEEEKARQEAEAKRLEAEKAAQEAEAKRIEEEKQKLREQEEARKKAEEEAEKSMLDEQNRKLAALQNSIDGFSNQIEDIEEIKGGFSGPPTFTGYIVPLGFHANSQATHILYRLRGDKKEVLCYLISPRIRLDEWNGARVEVSGTLRHPDNWTLPVLKVMRIINK